MSCVQFAAGLQRERRAYTQRKGEPMERAMARAIIDCATDPSHPRFIEAVRMLLALDPAYSEAVEAYSARESAQDTSAMPRIIIQTAPSPDGARVIEVHPARGDVTQAATDTCASQPEPSAA